MSANEMPERHTDTERNKIISRASSDLEQIINGHDPEIHHLGNRVWDRLDKMALEIENRSDLCASEQQVRALDPRIYRLNAEALAEIKATVDGESDQDVGHIIYSLLDEIAALTPAPQAATPTAQEAVPVWKSVERKFYRSEWPLAKLLEARNGGLVTDEGEAWVYRYTHKDGVGGEYDMLVRRELVAHPPQPSEAVAEALHEIRAAIRDGDLSQGVRLDIIDKIALRALKGANQ